MERSIAALTFAHRNGGATEFSGRVASFLARERLARLGIDDPIIVFEKRKRVRIDCGCLAIGTNSERARDWLLLNGPTAIATLNKGDLYIVGVGGDGALTVQLRMVTGGYPILAAKEYASVAGVGPVGYLEPGTLMLGEAAAIEKGIRLDVTESILVQPFLMNRGGSPSIVFVLCATKGLPDPLDTIPELQA